MNKLNEIAALGFKVTWRLIVIGMYGESYFSSQLSKESVFEYLVGQLETENDETDNIIKLICEKEDDIKIKELLYAFAEAEETEVALQWRKWRVYLLKTLLDNISRDYLRGLLELTEFWVLVGMPQEGPHIYPKPGSQQDYFTQDVFDLLFAKNKQWVKDEIEHIKLLEK